MGSRKDKVRRMVKKVLRLRPVRFVADIIRIYFDAHVSRSAAQLAYFLIMTFFPILICIAAFPGRIGLYLRDLLTGLKTLLPQGVFAILEDYFGYLDTNFSVAMLITGSVLTVLFAAAAIRGLTSIFHEIYRTPRQRSLFRFLGSFLFALLLLVTVYLAAIVMLTGSRLFPGAGELLLIPAVFLFFFLLFRFASPTLHPHPPIVPGALLASGALVITSVVFSAAVAHSTRYSLIYGSLASVIVLLVWLYLCGTVLILGCAVNYILFCRRERRSR